MELTLTELEQAINYWRLQQPSSGEEHTLSPAVNKLATVYALMIYHHRKDVPLQELSSAVQQLIADWRQLAAAHPA